MSLPPGLEASLSILTTSQQNLCKELCSDELGQSHLFEKWPSTPTNDEQVVSKIQNFGKQLEDLNDSYTDGGLKGYITNARALLGRSKKGINPLEGWTPSIPTSGQTFEIGTSEYDEVESLGIPELNKVGFVLVAGGLGERLGYSSIKIGLPTEMTTETSYMKYYSEYILAYQSKYGTDGSCQLPLCIMTSNDTNDHTVKLLEDNDYFGLSKDQITIVQQGMGVPALTNNDAKIALSDDGFSVTTKPHGHGDVHSLLFQHGVAKNFLSKGMKYIVFFQDTNGLAFHTMPLCIGVTKKFKLIMNSLAVPRKAKQAIGGITKLINTSTGEKRTINVEYNQLDPLLRATGYPDGDVNDEKTGFSPYPGNINQLLFDLQGYSDALDKAKGIMPEFVNPKYKDETKTEFKKPTRLECMMQDFPTVIPAELVDRVGYTSIDADVCFSPVKNATEDGIKLQAKGTAPGVAASGEADQYGAIRKIMLSLGCAIEDAQAESYRGISITPGPSIVIKPSFCCCPGEYKEKFTSPPSIKVSSKSSLVIGGPGNVKIESLELDGALIIDCEEGSSGTIKDLVVKNEGWIKVADETNKDEIIRMRGYCIEKKETKKITFKKDGTIEGM